MGTIPIFRISDAKVSPTKVPIKSSSFAKAVSSAKVSSFTNKSGADEPLFFPKVESSTKLPILPRQDALEPAIRQLTTVPSPIKLLTTPPVTLDDVLKVFKSIKSSIDFNLNF